MKNKLQILWDYDDCDCETCGMSYSQGATVVYNGVVIMDARAAASCFGGPQVEEGHILKKLCNYLNIDVEGLDHMYDHTGAGGDEWPEIGNC